MPGRMRLCGFSCSQKSMIFFLMAMMIMTVGLHVVEFFTQTPFPISPYIIQVDQLGTYKTNGSLRQKLPIGNGTRMLGDKPFSEYLSLTLGKMNSEIHELIVKHQHVNRTEIKNLSNNIRVIQRKILKQERHPPEMVQIGDITEVKDLAHQYLRLLRHVINKTHTAFHEKQERDEILARKAMVERIKRSHLNNTKQEQNIQANRNRQEARKKQQMNQVGKRQVVQPKQAKKSKYKVREIKHCLPLKKLSPPGHITALASFPGSGNTWLRHLLQEVTGLMTGSAHPDPYLLKGGFPGEKSGDGSVLVVKNHMSPKRNTRRAIILVRNPFKTLVADYNRHNKISSNEHTGHADEKLFSEEEWKHRANVIGAKWYEFYTEWLDLKQPLLVLTYEDLKKDVLYNVKRIVNFLGQSVPLDNYKCMLNNSEGIYHRKSKKVEVTLFNKEQISLTKMYAGFLNQKLKKYNVTVDDSVPT